MDEEKEDKADFGIARASRFYDRAVMQEKSSRRQKDLAWQQAHLCHLKWTASQVDGWSVFQLALNHACNAHLSPMCLELFAGDDAQCPVMSSMKLHLHHRRSLSVSKTVQTTKRGKMKMSRLARSADTTIDDTLPPDIAASARRQLPT